jgi:hypothetical protein
LRDASINNNNNNNNKQQQQQTATKSIRQQQRTATTRQPRTAPGPASAELAPVIPRPLFGSAAIGAGALRSGAAAAKPRLARAARLPKRIFEKEEEKKKDTEIDGKKKVEEEGRHGHWLETRNTVGPRKEKKERKKARKKK